MDTPSARLRLGSIACANPRCRHARRYGHDYCAGPRCGMFDPSGRPVKQRERRDPTALAHHINVRLDRDMRERITAWRAEHDPGAAWAEVARALIRRGLDAK